MISTKYRYTLTDHLCRLCGTGRILMVTSGVITGGGNPMYVCSTCEECASGMGPNKLCYCGYSTPTRVGSDFTCYRGDLSQEAKDAGWKVHKKHHFLSVLRRVIK